MFKLKNKYMHISVFGCTGWNYNSIYITRNFCTENCSIRMSVTGFSVTSIYSKHFAVVVSRNLRLHDGDSPLTVIFAPHFRLLVHSFLITAKVALYPALLVYSGFASRYFEFQKNITVSFLK